MNQALSTISNLAACTLLSCSSAVFAQQAAPAAPQNVVQLSANGTVEVQQDLLSIVLGITREGTDPNLLQSQLKAAIEAALAEARKSAQPGQLDLRTGNFSLSPRYGRDGKPIGWQGSAELVLEGRDFARITAAAGRIQTLTVSSVGFGLSREQRVRVEAESQTIAIERFKARASEIARSFGFAGYGLREVNVSSNDQGVSPRPRMLAMDARANLADSPMPVEAGKTSVVVNVSGSVQLK
ncbi:MAG: SIMPL domain-containing protein [Rhodoferax sp.]